jgi:hypothetical protein
MNKYIEMYDKISTYPDTPNTYYYNNRDTNERYKVVKSKDKNTLWIREYNPETKKYDKKPTSVSVYGHMHRAIAKYHSCLDAIDKDTGWH